MNISNLLCDNTSQQKELLNYNRNGSNSIIIKRNIRYLDNKTQTEPVIHKFNRNSAISIVHQENRNSILYEDIISFCIFCKIKLSMIKSREIILLSVNLLKNDISTNEFSRKLNDIIKDDKDVFDFYKFVFESFELKLNSPLINSIRDIVRWFASNKIMSANVYSCTDLLVNIVDRESSKLLLYCIMRCFHKTDNIIHSQGDLFTSANIFFKNLPSKCLYSQRKQDQQVQNDYYDMEGDFLNPYFPRKRELVPNLTPIKNMKDYLPTKPYRFFTESYVLKEISLSKGSFGFLYNDKYKSFPPRDGTNRAGRQKTFSDSLVYAEIHSFQEDLEICETLRYEINNFTPSSTVCGNGVLKMCKFIFGERWDEIDSCIYDSECREKIYNISHRYLEYIERKHRNLLLKNKYLLECRTCNSFLQSIIVPNFLQLTSTVLKFELTDDSVESLLSELSEPISKRHYYVNWLLDSDYLDIMKGAKYMYLSPILACILYYFSLLSNQIYPLLSYDPMMFQSYTTILDMVSETIFDQYDTPLPKKILTKKKILLKSLKKIINSKKVLDTVAAEVTEHFGKLNSNFAAVVPLLGYLHDAVSKAQLELHTKELINLIKLFGSDHKYLNVYKLAIQKFNIESLIYADVNKQENTIRFSKVEL